jgi:hypothetical protein
MVFLPAGLVALSLSGLLLTEWLINILLPFATYVRGKNTRQA